MRPPRKSNVAIENSYASAIQKKQLFDELMPMIHAVARAGGGAEKILKQSEAAAAANLVYSMGSDKADVSLKASVEILNRTTGKPVERSFNIYGDLSKLNEKDLDNQILRAIQRTGSPQLLEKIIQPIEVSPAPAKVKQSRKPRISNPV